MVIHKNHRIFIRSYFDGIDVQSLTCHVIGTVVGHFEFDIVRRNDLTEHSVSGLFTYVSPDRVAESKSFICATIAALSNYLYAVIAVLFRIHIQKDRVLIIGDVLTGKVFILADGTVTTGTMANNGAVSKALDVTTISYTIPKGFHSGTGTVKITVEEKNVTPTKSEQTITPTSGKVLSKVTVAAIPAAYQDVSGVTAAAANVLDGKYFVTSTGVKTEGSMPNNGATGGTIDGLSVTSMTIPAGYTSGGTVSLDSTIEEALAAI